MKTAVIHKKNGASALITMLIYIIILSLLLGSLMQWVGTENIQVERRKQRISSLYGAEAAVQRAMCQIQYLMTSQYPMNGYISGPVAPTDANLAALSSPTSVAQLNDFTFSSINNVFTSGTSSNRYVQAQIPIGSTDPFAGLYTSRATIRCSATASQIGRYDVPQSISQEVYIDYIPIFQYAIFYNMDMEVFNGPTMTINGKVHVNGNFYFNNFGNLTIKNNVTVTGDMVRGLKKWDSTTSSWKAGNPTWNLGTGDFIVHNPFTGTDVNGKSGSPPVYYDSNTPDWATVALTKWGGGVKTKDQGIAAITPPLPTDVLAAAIDPANPYHVMIERPVISSIVGATRNISDSNTSKNAKMAFSASLVIHRSGANVYYEIPIKDSFGVVTSFKTVNLKNKDQIVPPAITTLHDQREYLMDNNKVEISEFKLEKLYGAIDSSGQFLDNSTGTPITYSTDGPSDPVSPSPFNGVVYIYDDGYNGTTGTGYRPGIRIDDSATGGGSATKNYSLPSTAKGISIVSENPVYVKGHFNADGNGTTAPEGTGASGGTISNPIIENSYDPSTSANPTGVKPSMIVADAVSFMSASWNNATEDNNASMSTLWANRTTTAATTEVNAAIIAGSSRTSPSADLSSGDGTTGGIHNYPRFMENWNSKNFKISGSMVSLFYSAQSKSYFVDSGASPKYVYQPPVRYYSFDTDFLNPNKLPPGTPVIRRFANGVWSKN